MIKPDDFIIQVNEINPHLKRLKYKPDELCGLLDLSINTMRKHRANGWLTLDVATVYKLMRDIENRAKHQIKTN